MNKTISVYDLLGLIKEGKAPEFLRYDNLIWQYKEQFDDYFNGEEYLIGDGFDDWDNAKTYLNEKVEILEEDKPIIEKLNLDREPLRGREVPRAIDYLLEGRINEIIEFLSRKEDK